MEMKTSILVDSMEIYHHIQPVVDLESDKIYGFEFLLRSSHSLNPEQLFSEAKDRDVLFQLDMKSIFTIIQHAHIHYLKDTLIFINVYPSTLVEPLFLYKLMELLTMQNIKANSIIFEINESEKPVDLAVLSKYVEKYRELGFLISIDDLGKGEANMTSILDIQPDIVKLDCYFSENLALSPRKQKAIQYFVEVLDGESTVVLEGIELEEDLRVAKEIGVPFGQGYYLGRPEPLDYYLKHTMGTGTLAR